VINTGQFNELKGSSLARAESKSIASRSPQAEATKSHNPNTTPTMYRSVPTVRRGLFVFVVMVSSTLIVEVISSQR
jgi:hypothetical protein